MLLRPNSASHVVHWAPKERKICGPRTARRLTLTIQTLSPYFFRSFAASSVTRRMYICRRFCRSGTVAAVITRACVRPVSTRPHLGKARMTDAAKGPGSLNCTMSTTRLSASRSSSMCWVLDNPMSPTTLAPDARSSQVRTFSLATRSLNFLGFANRLKWSGTLVPGSKSTDLELPASCVTWNPSRCRWAARAVLPTRPGPAPATMTFVPRRFARLL